jgi:hypothetical protein
LSKTTEKLGLQRSGSSAVGELVDVYGSGPTPIEARSGGSPAKGWNPAPAKRLKLAPGTDHATAESLARYVVAFGQGIGRVGAAGDEWYLELSAPDDASMVIGQFSELVTGECAL